MENFNEGILQAPSSPISIDDDKNRQETAYLTDLKTFFPELVWKEVLGKMTKSDDIENCSNSSPFFWKVLEKKRKTNVVLPQVFVLLDNYFADDEPNNDALNDLIREIETFGPRMLLRGNITVSDRDVDNKEKEKALKRIINYRLVCKTWNTGIEQLYQSQKAGHFMLKLEMGHLHLFWEDPWTSPSDHRSNVSSDQFDAVKRTLPFLQGNQTFQVFKGNVKQAKIDTVDVYKFEKNKRKGTLQDFFQHFNATHENVGNKIPKKNPFLDRKVEFVGINFGKDMHNNRYQGYLNEIVQILTKYGSEVWFVSFDFHVEVKIEYAQKFYLQLQEFLELLPNLKVLHINYKLALSLDMFRSGPIFNMVSVCQSLELQQEALWQGMSLDLLPSLPKLQYLDTNNLPSSLFNEFMNKSRNISQLQVHKDKYHNGYNLFPLNVQTLTALSIEFCSIEDFEKFESSSILTNIKRFYFWYKNISEFVPWSRIFSALERKLSESCEELILQLPNPTTNEQINQVLVDSHTCRLKIPSLKRITIFDDTVFCMDFLLPCKLIEFVSLRYHNIGNQHEISKHFKKQQENFLEFGSNQAIQFVGYKEKMEESNIWGEFPNMRELTIHGKIKKGGLMNYCCKRGTTCTVVKYVW